MTETPRPNTNEVQQYIDGAMKRMETSPATLEAFEKRLLPKIKRASSATQQALKDVQDLKGQISQAETRLRMAELQAESAQGSVNAYIDEIVSLKWGIEEPLPAPSGPENLPGGSVTPMNRHERRAAGVKAKTDEEPSAN